MIVRMTEDGRKLETVRISSCSPGGIGRIPLAERGLRDSAAIPPILTAVTCPSLKFLACRHEGGACRCWDPGVGQAPTARLVAGQRRAGECGDERPASTRSKRKSPNSLYA